MPSYLPRERQMQPYWPKAAVIHGLQSGVLIQGVLRVNSRNYEESYIDNPAGDIHQDIMILGMHDRNRSLHGDVVVVRLKERNRWIVRDSLYEAWRNGHLNVPYDEDGQPLTIPPVKTIKTDLSGENLLSDATDFLPISIQQKVDPTKLSTAVSLSKNKRYSQDSFVRLGVQMELNRIRKQKNGYQQHFGDVNSNKKLLFSENATEMLLKELEKVTDLEKSVDEASGDRNSYPSENLGLLPVAECKLDPDVAKKMSDLCITKDNHIDIFTHAKNRIEQATLSAVAALAPTVRGALATDMIKQTQTNYRILADMSDEDWGIPDICLQKTAEVVFIAHAKNCRIAVGQLKLMADGNTNWGLFSPNDPRMPRMVIPDSDIPQKLYEYPQEINKYLFTANMVEWQATAQYARGRLYKCLGEAGEVDAETEGILMSNDVDTREFSAHALRSLPLIEGIPWTIDEKEFKYRRDYRQETVFTIDASNTLDLEDALHIKRIADCDDKGTPGWEVGVHIADVSHFLLPRTELDRWAENRATSVFLVHKVIHMLPRILCEELCSLNPNNDRLTFSVVWKMNEEAQIKKQWFGRTIIHSCVKLSYDHAQAIINDTDSICEANLPNIYNKKSLEQVKQAVLNLNQLARKLKQRRLDLGSLRLDQRKLKFVLHPEDNLPLGVGAEERSEANYLVEEFLLLANRAVAKQIYDHFPDHALLRRHPAPKAKILREMEEKCEFLNVPVNFEDGRSIAKSLFEYFNNETSRLVIYPALIQFVMRCMQLAVYFCSSTKKNYHHYALNVPLYTHFTSPMRRYPDIIVHRLLASSLGYSPPPAFSPMELEKICHKCNDRKLNAKNASDQSAVLFFGLFIQKLKRLETIGVVINVLDAAVDLLLVKYNIVQRVYTNRLKLAREPRFMDGVSGVLCLYWDSTLVAEVTQRRKSRAYNKRSEDLLDGEKTSVTDKQQREDIAYNMEANAAKSIPDDKSKRHFVIDPSLEQTLKIFSPVRVFLTPSFEPLKFVTIIEPTPDNYPLSDNEIKMLLE